MNTPRRMEISEDKTKVIYSMDFIKEIINYLHSLNTKEAKEYAFKLSVDESRIPKMSEEEILTRSLTSEERKLLYTSSVPKASEILKTLRTLVDEENSDNS